MQHIQIHGATVVSRGIIGTPFVLSLSFGFSRTSQLSQLSQPTNHELAAFRTNEQNILAVNMMSKWSEMNLIVSVVLSKENIFSSCSKFSIYG